MIYVHPVLGATLVAALVAVAVVGLRGRHAAPYARAARATHSRSAPWIYLAMLATGALGVGSVAWLRTDLQLGASAHGRLMAATLAAMTIAWWLSQSIQRNPTVRQVHPWVGVLATALAVTGAALGLGLLP